MYNPYEDINAPRIWKRLNAHLLMMMSMIYLKVGVELTSSYEKIGGGVNMKPVKNALITKVQEEPSDPNKYWCKQCHSVNSGGVSFTEIGYGRATLMSLNGEVDGMQLDDYGDFEITLYRCYECGCEAENAYTIFTRRRIRGG